MKKLLFNTVKQPHQAVVTRANWKKPGRWSAGFLLTALLGFQVGANAQTCGTTISTFPHIQDFQTATVGAPGVLPTGWATSPATGFRFEIEDGQPTSGTTTGPSADHTTGNATTGKYVYTESSSGTTGAEAFLTSPCLDLTGLTSPGFDFWYHMHGATTGTMEAQVSTNGGTTWTTLTTLTGAQQTANTDPWLKRTVSLAGYSGIVQIRFRGVRGTSFTSDMAIDDVKFYNIPSIDAELVAITSPNLSGCGFSATENVTISIKNNGIAAITSVPVSYTLGTNTVNETAAINIAPGATGTYTFTAKANLAAGGTYSLSASVALPSDGDPSNNTRTRSINNPLVTTFPYIQDFETGVTGAPGTLPSGWAQSSVPASTTYKWHMQAGPTSSSLTGPNVDHTLGTATGKYVYTEASNGVANDVAELVTPCFNLTGLTTPGIEFWYHMAGPGMGPMNIDVSTNSGATWTNLHTFTGPQQTAEADPWLKKTISLSAYVGQTVRIRFKGTKIASAGAGFDFEGDMSIDDFKIFNIPAIDAELVAITAPAASSGCAFTATENVTISIKNNGIAAITSIPVSYTLGTNTVNETAAVNIAPGATGSYTFTAKANLATPATYSLSASTALASDGDASNNTKTRSITVVPNVSTFPYLQNFDAGAGGWVASGTNSSWTLGTPAKTVINSAASGANSWVTNLTGTYNSSENSRVVGPCFNFSSLVQPIITMKIWWESEEDWDGAVLQSSINGGATWQNVGAFNDPNNWYNNDAITGTPGGQSVGWSGTGTLGSGGWVTAKHNLTGLGGQSSVLLRVAFGADGSFQFDGFAFDDVAIFESPANDVGVVAITSPIASGCGFTATENVCVTITNLGSTATPSFPISYQIGTNPAVTENVTTPIAPGATATFCFTTKANLTAVGTYNVVVTTNLANDGNPTNNSATKAVTVVPTISTLPYTEGFENGNGGWIAGGTASSWALGTPAKTVINTAGTGTKSWVTNLTGTYNASEQSYVVGPCFNFSGMPDPDFEMKAWWDMEDNYEKAALQSSIDGGVTWQHVGAFGQPNNWYNNNSTFGPGVGGGVKEGWSGSSNGWVKVKHKLTGLGGQSSVLLRVAFGADGIVQEDGFAFDDIRIGDNTGNLSIVSFVPLTQLCGFGGNEKVEVVLENLGSTPVSGYTISYTVNNGQTTAGPFTAPTVPTLQAGVPTNFTFPVGANLSQPGNYTIVVTVNNPNDPEPANNSITYTIANASFPSLPPTFDFESAATGVTGMRVITSTQSSVTENVAASRPLAGAPATSTKGMLMEGTSATNWVMPVGLTDPWTNNLNHKSAAYICFAPQGAANPGQPLWLSFDLKQLFKTANANTNFRVTVNGTQVGPTYRPPFAGTPIDWQKVYVDLTPYAQLLNIQVGLESSVAEPFANGTGTANLIDNIRFQRVNPTGITNKVFQSSINVYPNPSNGVFAVTVPTVKAFTLEVTDLTGKVVMRQAVKGSNQAQLDLHGNAQGVYLLKITSEGASAVQKIILE